MTLTHITREEFIFQSDESEAELGKFTVIGKFVLKYNVGGVSGAEKRAGADAHAGRKWGEWGREMDQAWDKGTGRWGEKMAEAAGAVSVDVFFAKENGVRGVRFERVA